MTETSLCNLLSQKNIFHRKKFLSQKLDFGTEKQVSVEENKFLSQKEVSVTDQEVSVAEKKFLHRKNCPNKATRGVH